MAGPNQWPNETNSFAVPTAQAATATAISVAPALLLGGLALFIREDLGFGTTQLGLAVGMFYAAAASTAIGAGMLSGRLGPSRAVALGLTLTAVTLACLAVVSGWLWLALLLAVAGIASAVVQVSSNHLIVVGVRREKQGLAFGVKQAAVPLASVVGGLSVLAVEAGFSWRWILAVAAIAAIGVVALGARGTIRGRRSVPMGPVSPVRAAPLALMGAGALLASSAGNAPVAFVVEAGVLTGLNAEASGLVLAVAGGMGVLTRLLGGVAADRLGRDPHLLLILLLLSGAAAHVVLALAAEPPVWQVAVVLAFVGAWGWPGLLWLGVARRYERSLTLALGRVQLGAFAGAVIGPISFGWIVDSWSYEIAWAVLAVQSAIGAGLIGASRILHTPRQTSTRQGRWHSR